MELLVQCVLEQCGWLGLCGFYLYCEVYDLDDLMGFLEFIIRFFGFKKGLENYNDEIEFFSDVELIELI